MAAAIAVSQWLWDSLAGVAVARAYGTLGNANVLGALLVLLIPLAYGELIAARSATARLLAGNALAAMALALLLTLSRSSWVGLGVAAVILLAGRQLPTVRIQLALTTGAVALAVVAALALGGIEQGTNSRGAVYSTETLSVRLQVWQDTIPLILSRPLAGYRPDSFGLVYPRFQSGNGLTTSSSTRHIRNSSRSPRRRA